MMTDLRDPVVIKRLVDVQLWLADAGRLDLDTDAKGALFWLQSNMARRSEVWQGLQDMLKNAVENSAEA
jgi:hypothetical protein